MKAALFVLVSVLLALALVCFARSLGAFNTPYREQFKWLLASVSWLLALLVTGLLGSIVFNQ